MEMLSSFLAGIPTDASWSQSYALRLGDDFFGVVVSVHTPITSVAVTGKEILDHCVRTAKNGMTREQFLTLFAGFTSDGIDIAAIFLSGKTATVFTQGKVDIQLSRGGKTRILVSGAGKGAYVAGPVVEEDYYILATNAFTQEFHSLDTTTTPQALSDEYVATLHGMSESSQMSALFLQILPGVRVAPTVTAEVSPPTSREVVPRIAKMKLSSFHVAFPVLNISSLLPRSQKGKKAFRLAIGLLVAILLLIFLSMYLTAARARSVAQTLTPYTQRFDTLTALPTERRLEELQGLRELSRDLASRKKESKDSALTRGYDQLLSKVDGKFTSISGEKYLDKLHIFYDFRLVAADFVASSVAFDVPGKLAVFLDGAHSRLLSLSLEKKEAQTLTVDEKLQGPFSVAVDNRKAYVLGNEGVMQLSLPLDVMGSVVVNKDVTWVAPKFIDTFGSNTYILDAGARNLLKYDLEDPSASVSGWIKNKVGLDFDSVTSLRIDGSVWLGTTTGKIFHFTAGSPTSFSYQGVLDPPSTPVYVYATKESEKLYVLEPHASRLLVLTKNGTYQEAVTSPDLATATGIIVDESTNKAYVLSGSLVYEVEL